MMFGYWNWWRKRWSELWFSNEKQNFISSHPVYNAAAREFALIYHGSDLLKVDVITGNIVKRISIVENIAARLHREDGWVSSRVSMKHQDKGRLITQQSNILVGDFSYFRNYIFNYLGRVNLLTDEVEYLQLPVQLMREEGKEGELLWSAEGSIEPWGKKKKKGELKQNYWSLVHNQTKNSRGFEVMGDERSRGNGWGHVATQIPTVIGDYLYAPVMNGTVYVIKWKAEKLDENALVSINDLGSAGQAWTRASLSFANGRIYVHTIKAVICIK